MVIVYVSPLSATECGHVDRLDTIWSIKKSVKSHGVDSIADVCFTGRNYNSRASAIGTKDVPVSEGEVSIVEHIKTVSGVVPYFHSADGRPDL